MRAARALHRVLNCAPHQPRPVHAGGHSTHGIARCEAGRLTLCIAVRRHTLHATRRPHLDKSEIQLGTGVLQRVAMWRPSTAVRIRRTADLWHSLRIRGISRRSGNTPRASRVPTPVGLGDVYHRAMCSARPQPLSISRPLATASSHALLSLPLHLMHLLRAPRVCTRPRVLLPIGDACKPLRLLGTVQVRSRK